MYWTSGTNQGPLNERRHFWCSDGSEIEKSAPWGLDQPNSVFLEKCVALVFEESHDSLRYDEITLHDYPCNLTTGFICTFGD
jgi:hypothetical protein